MGEDKSIKIIGIAGGIGSGKSTVTDYLRLSGYSVYDADEIAREVVMPGEHALKKLTAFFGKEIISDDGSLDRRRLAQISFESENKTKKLNEILHKEIDRRIDRYIKTYHGERNVVFISAPLFFEAELERKCDQTWTVIADKEVRIKRSMERDGLPRKEIEDRMNRQMSDEERTEKADHIIINHGTKEQLIDKVNQLLSTLK